MLLLNPVAPLLEGMEVAVVQGRSPDLGWIAYSATASFVTLVAAWVMFYRLEPTFADNV